MNVRYLTKVVLANVIVTLLALEGLGLIGSYIRNGDLFYTRAKTAAPEESPKVNSTTTALFQFHPYWGYSNTPNYLVRNILPPGLLQSYLYPLSPNEASWLDTGANNYGFMSPYNYPAFIKDSNVAVVGVFGGSVAHWFALQGAERLKKQLELNGPFKGKDVRIINFAHGGMKQPQQLLILNFFIAAGQRFDAVVNIDGFNEMFVGPALRESNMAVTMPNVGMVGQLLSMIEANRIGGDRLVAMGKSIEMKLKYNQLQRLENQGIFAKSAFLNFVLVQYEGVLHARYAKLQEQLNAVAVDNTPLIQFAPWAASPDGETNPLRQIANLWERASFQMKEVLMSQKIPYYHFLQPNQYVGHHQFSARERQFLVGEPKFKQAAEIGYPVFLESGKKLQDEGVKFHDLTHLFDETDEIVYSDSCCHLNQNGNVRMADAIAEEINR